MNIGGIRFLLCWTYRTPARTSSAPWATLPESILPDPGWDVPSPADALPERIWLAAAPATSAPPYPRARRRLRPSWSADPGSELWSFMSLSVSLSAGRCPPLAGKVVGGVIHRQDCMPGTGDEQRARGAPARVAGGCGRHRLAREGLYAWTSRSRRRRRRRVPGCGTSCG